ncbi:hypothetical protein SDC9_181986 [bioreactor metagenome]|uniref:Uncharacterized protein n=1 Tax=bioreactor metagenome TaxID=1076179 RepID=A0A645H7Z6_9ZZZZ
MGFGDHGHNILQRGGGFHRADMIVLHAAHRLENAVKPGISCIGRVFGSVAHEHNGGLIDVILSRFFSDDASKLSIVLITRKQRFTDRKRIELILERCDCFDHLIILKAIHDMGGLHHQRLNAIRYQAVHRFFNIVNLLVVAAFELVNNDLACEGTAHLKFRERVGDVLFNGADGSSTALIIAGAKTHHQNSLFPCMRCRCALGCVDFGRSTFRCRC